MISFFKRICALLAVGAALPLGCAPSKNVGEAKAAPAVSKPSLFRDVAQSAGLTFQHSNGATGKWYYIEENAPGCALFDMDNDGDLDVLLVQSGSFPRTKADPKNFCALYRNKGDGTFEDITKGSGVDRDLGYGMGVAVGDYDNDGWSDLYITSYGGNHLLRNEKGTGQFQDVTQAAGVGDTDKGPRFATSSAFGDYDNDGKLDLFVCHYAPWTPENNTVCRNGKAEAEYCTPDVLDLDTQRLYRNEGGGKFSDVTEKAGLGKLKLHGHGVVWLDYNGDGHEDLFVASDLTPQALLKNNGKGGFTDVAEETGAAYDMDAQQIAGMGIALGDYDNSGRESLFLTNFSQQPNTLFKNTGDLWEDKSMAANVAVPHLPFLGFGCDFLDYDADGRLDLAVANGHVVLSVAETTEGVTYKQRKQLFHNEGGGRFTEITENLGDLGTPTVGRGLATGDFDNDGKLDFLVSNQNGPPQLFKNEGKTGHWVRFKTVGVKSNRDGYHAKVTLWAGGKRQFSEVHSATSFLSHGDSRVYFGLGPTTRIDKVEVRWPSGAKDTLSGLDTDRDYIVTEGKGVKR